VRTELDAGIVEWVGCLGAAGADHVMGRFGMGRSWAYHRLGSLVADGLLELRPMLHRHAGLYVASLEGLRWRGLERLGVYRVSASGFVHAWELARVAVALHWGLEGWRMLSEREIRAHESEEGELVASARLGEVAGHPSLHRPDLALISPHGRTVTVEVELSVKAPRRLQAICRGWARARHITHVYYLAAPAAARAVSAAVDRTRSQERITVLPLHGVCALADAAREEAGDARN
jgi:hypothetical protein